MEAGDKEGLSQLLAKWATREMGFLPPRDTAATALTPGSLDRICHGGKMADVWEFVLKSVRSVQSVRKIRGNLALQTGGTRSKGGKARLDAGQEGGKARLDAGQEGARGQGGQEEADRQHLLQQRHQLSGEATQLLKDLGHLETDMQRLETELALAARDYEAGQSAVWETEKQGRLLQLFANRVDETCQEQAGYQQRIATRTRNLANLAQKARGQLYAGQGGDGGENGGEEEGENEKTQGLETAAEREVRETCRTMGSFLQKALQGDFGTDTSTFQQGKQTLWSSVERLVAGFPVMDVLQGLISNTHRAAAALHSKTSRINIQQDAQRLRFKYENTGKLTDLSVPPTLLTSVHSLLEEAQLQHIQRFLDTEQHRNVAWRGEQQLEEHKSRTMALIKQRLPDPPHWKLARTLMDTELTLAAERTALDTLQTEANRLRENLHAADRQQQSLLLTYSKLQDFKEVADKKQELIRVLAKQNANSKTRLAAHRQEIQDYIDRALLGHRAEVQMLTSGLVNCVTMEADKFVSLPLSLLLLLHLPSEGKVPLTDLSIHHVLQLTTAPLQQSLLEALTLLHFPVYKAAEHALPHVVQMKRRKEEAEQQTQRLEQAAVLTWGQGHGRRLKDADVSGLCRQMQEEERRLVERLVPPLQRCVEKMADARAGTARVRQLHQDWWEQPAQFSVPWVGVDQASYQRWYDRWRNGVTKLRQSLK